MPGEPLHVVIIGGGTGGLCLAQALHWSGVAVRVFERDHGRADRLRGYRLSIHATGARALEACLPGARYRRLLEQAGQRSQSLTFLTHRLERLLAIRFPPGPPGESYTEGDLPIERLALRRSLLDGLDEVVTFDQSFVRYDHAPDGRVVAHFEDGSTATGDLLVGADGAGSRVRRQLLPRAERVDTGIFAVTGKVPLTAEVREATPPAILRGPTLVPGPRGCFLFANAVEHAPGAAGEDGLDSYVTWGFSARREAFPLPDPPEAADAESLRAAAMALMRDWHPAFLRLVGGADLATVTAFRVRTSVPIAPWPTRNVTLLGDALHNMTPFRGIGANMALRDAESLFRTIVAAERGTVPLLAALAAYERDMVHRGFRAVRASLQEMKRLHAEGLFARGLRTTMFRLFDRMGPLKGAYHG